MLAGTSSSQSHRYCRPAEPSIIGNATASGCIRSLTTTEFDLYGVRIGVFRQRSIGLYAGKFPIDARLADDGDADTAKLTFVMPRHLGDQGLKGCIDSCLKLGGRQIDDRRENFLRHLGRIEEDTATNRLTPASGAKSSTCHSSATSQTPLLRDPPARSAAMAWNSPTDCASGGSANAALPRRENSARASVL